jgi:DNA-binding beta-propeller fold protein YncE
MRNAHFALLILFVPAAAWSQTGNQTGYSPQTPAGGYIVNGMSTINDMIHPPPPSLTLPLHWGSFRCRADGQWVYTTYSIVFTSLISFHVEEQDELTGKRCDNPTSGNGQGGPLPNSNSTDSFGPTVGGMPPPAPDFRRHATAALPAPGAEVPRLTAPVRALPFPPDYSPPLLSFPPCDPATASHVLEVNHLSGTVTRLNSCNQETIAVIPVQSRPLQVAITPDTRTAIVTSFDNAISFIDMSANRVVNVLSTDSNTNPSGIAISPDGKRAYVTSFNTSGSAVLVVDIQQGQILSQISVDAYPQSVFLSPDGSVAYVTFPFGNQVRLIDTLTGLVFGALPIGETYGVAFNSTGTRAYITSQQSQSVEVVDTSTYSIVQSISLTVPPDEIKMTPDDQWLFGNSYLGNASIIINAATGEVDTTVGSAPLHGLAIVQ